MTLTTITIIEVVIALLIFLYFFIYNFYQKKYYDQAYRPKSIKIGQIKRYPTQYIIDGFVSVSSEKQYQEAVALKMINDKVNTGQDISINNINFLMGYTYGASFNMLNKTFLPFLEPIEGIKISAPFMGLHMDYYTTYNPKMFVDAVKYYISKGHSVLIQLDLATILSKKGFYPISELIVGYNNNEFYYYEMLGTNNEGKKHISKQKLIDATYKLNGKFRKPWRYGFSIFEAREKNNEIEKIIKRNGKSLIGEKKNQTALGAQAIAEFAKHIKSSKTFNSQWVLENLEYSRSDNAEFFEEFFKDDLELKEVANLFKVVSENYSSALKISKQTINEENIDKMSMLLLRNSQLEEDIGKLLEKDSYELTSN